MNSLSEFLLRCLILICVFLVAGKVSESITALALRMRGSMHPAPVAEDALRKLREMNADMVYMTVIIFVGYVVVAYLEN